MIGTGKALEKPRVVSQPGATQASVGDVNQWVLRHGRGNIAYRDALTRVSLNEW